MFIQPIAINVFVYYGIIISEGELKTIMKRQGMNDVYAFVYSNKLQYKKMGNASKGNQYVIGKEIYSCYGFNYMNLQDGVKLTDKNNLPFTVKLSMEEEFEVKEKLYKPGFFNIADYYLVFNYDKNE